ncbi:Bor family protein [Erwinia sp. Eh17-17]|uniref:Bor family protein n=1 Tax=Erwinia sp. Eh17-17 TaxID=3080330 RepID=UPI003207F432
MKKILAIAAFAVLLSGCAQQTFQLKHNQVATPKQATTHHFFVSGIGQKKTLDAAAICGNADKVDRVEVQQTFPNILLSIVTFGIYTPREARVYCSL